MPDILDLPEGPRVLTEHGRERWEDALVIDGVRHFIPHVGAVPDNAWGRIPFVQPWKGALAAQIDNRVTEATTLRDILGQVGGNLMYVAADYTNTDLEFGLTLAEEAQAGDGILKNWINPVRHPDVIIVSPSAPQPTPEYPGPPEHILFPISGMGRPTPLVQQQLMFLEWDAKLNECLNPLGDSTPGLPTELADLSMSPGKHEFDGFLAEHYPNLVEAEQILSSYGMGLGERERPSAFLEEAMHAFPAVIINRMDLLHVVAENYGLIQAEMANGVGRLQSKWVSEGGAQAYYGLQSQIHDYMEAIKGHTTWLANEGTRAGQALDDLLLAYATAGLAQIAVIIERVRVFKDAAASLLDTDLTKPLKSLHNVVKGLGDIMLNDWTTAQSLASIENSVAGSADNTIQLGSSEHSAETFPGEGYGPGDIVDDWKPKAVLSG